MTSATDIKWTKYIPHSPHVKQHAFLWLDCKEAMFGGAAGGGKSDALLMAALQYVDVPGYAAIIFRRTFSDLSLPGAIMDRAQEWLSKSDAKWNDNKKTWTFPSGATLTFAYLQVDKDKFRYQGAEFQFIGFDELTQFPEDHYKYLFSRCRRPEAPADKEDFAWAARVARALAKVPLRVRGATNPGGEGHRWVARRFLDKLPDEPDEDTTEAWEASQQVANMRIFIPSKLEDNPSLDKGAYEASLRVLDPITRAQLRHGDWLIRQPGMWVFDAEAIDAAAQIGKEFDHLRKLGELGEPHGGAMKSGMDYGDFATVGLPLWSLELGGMYVPAKELHMSREDLEDIADGTMEMMRRFPFWWSTHIYDAAFAQSNRTLSKMVEKKLGMHNAIRRKGRPNTVPVSFAEYKMLCIRYVRLLLDNSLAYVNGDMSARRILAISPVNVMLLEQLKDYEEDEFGKPLKGGDDAVDALLAGVQPDAKMHRVIVEDMKRKAYPGAKTQPLGVRPYHKIRKEQQA